MEKKLTKGLFITFEGPEGCGKSTHSGRVYRDLRKDGYEAVFTAEPGGTALGERIRQILLGMEDIRLDPFAELLLFEADRAQHVSEVITPALEDEKVVICDRFNTATFAYQGHGLGMDMEEILAVDRIATRGRKPDLTVLMDIAPEAGLKRANAKREPDKMEKRSLEFHRRVREGYLELAKNDPDRMIVIDSSGEMEDVYGKVKEAIYGFVERHTRTG